MYVFCRDHARTIDSKSQLFISAYAKALEIIPRQLCDNAGFDATDVLNALRQKHAAGGEGAKNYGVDINTGAAVGRSGPGPCSNTARVWVLTLHMPHRLAPQHINAERSDAKALLCSTAHDCQVAGLLCGPSRPGLQYGFISDGRKRA